MKAKLYTYLILLFAGIFIVGCKSAAKLYEKGDYDEAVDLAVKKLQKKPGDVETKALLQNAYRFAVSDHENRIRSLSENSNELKWEWIYNEYSSLQRMYEAIKRSPEAYTTIHPMDYSSWLNTYSDKAAGVRNERGLRWMSNGDKMSFRNAYNEFQAALRLKPGDFDIQNKMNDAYENAVVNVVLIDAGNFGYRYSSYNNGLSNNRSFENDLSRNLQSYNNNRFVRFFTEWEARSSNIQPDQFIDLRYGPMNIGRIKDEKTTRVVTKEVVIKEIVYKPDSVVKVYGKVSAKITTVRRTMHSDGGMAVNIRDANGQWLWSDNFSGNHNWYTEFATYTGDERALSDSDRQLLNRKQESRPFENEIVKCIVGEINNNLYSGVRNYYSRF